ncbi:MAG: hypothetical protein JRJ58_15635 [Deltaproteobacteria bacterium]|nr:hypothetical protein [Deltaproteobacteria bacterium]
MRFLFALPDLAGNSPPILEVGRRLVARGHAVRMLAWPALREAVENRGCTYVPFNHAPVFDRAEKERMEETVYLYPAPGLPAFGMGFLPARTWLGRTRDAVMRAVFDRFMARGLRTLNEAREELELGSLSRLDALSGCAHRVLVMTSRAYDFEADELPPNVRYVGPQLETVTPGRWKSPWPPSDTRPLVLVGLSTDQMGQVPLLRNLIRALDELDVRALVTTGPGIDPTIFDTPNDVAIRQFVPHQDVMPEADLVITHAGHGTVIRALAAGVPMICIPLGRDQYDVAARVVWRGAGCKLSSRAGSKAISRRVASVLEDRRYGEVARELSASISRETRQNLAVLELETLGANKTSGGDIH